MFNPLINKLESTIQASQTEIRELEKQIEQLCDRQETDDENLSRLKRQIEQLCDRQETDDENLSRLKRHEVIATASIKAVKDSMEELDDDCIDIFKEELLAILSADPYAKRDR